MRAVSRHIRRDASRPRRVGRTCLSMFAHGLGRKQTSGCRNHREVRQLRRAAGALVQHPRWTLVPTASGSMSACRDVSGCCQQRASEQRRIAARPVVGSSHARGRARLAVNQSTHTKISMPIRELLRTPDLISDVLLLLSSDGTIDTPSHSLVTQLGLPAEALIGRRLDTLAAASAAAIQEYVQACAQSAHVVQGSFVLRHCTETIVFQA